MLLVASEHEEEKHIIEVLCMRDACRPLESEWNQWIYALKLSRIQY